MTTSKDDERIYLDHAATTPVRDEVRAAMEPFLADRAGNPSSLHREGRDARAALESARQEILASVGASDFDLLFTSGGTEADNAAILSAALGESRDPPTVIVASAVEHSAVLDTSGLLERIGARLVPAPVDGEGRLDLERRDEWLSERPRLVSLMAGNNETGALQPIEELGVHCRAAGVNVHCDAVQALGKIYLRFDEWPVDLVTLSAHKVHGPKGVGALLIRKGTPFVSTIRGGGQEGDRRAGTENLGGAVGFAAAVRLAVEEQPDEVARLDTMRRDLLRRVEEACVGSRSNTPVDSALPHILNVSFPGVEGESLVKALDHRGIAASTGSACNVASRKLSHVLKAMGRSDDEIRGSLRLSLGRSNHAAQADRIVSSLMESVEQLQRVAGVAPRTAGRNDATRT